MAGYIGVGGTELDFLF